MWWGGGPSGGPQEIGLNLDCKHLAAYDPELYRLLVAYPQEVIPIMDVVVNHHYAEHLLGPDDEAFASLQARVCAGSVHGDECV